MGVLEIGREGDREGEECCKGMMMRGGEGLVK